MVDPHITELKAAQTWAVVRQMEETKTIRKIVQRGGSLAVGQLKGIWMSGFRSAAGQIMQLAADAASWGGPEKALLVTLSRAVVAGNMERAQMIAASIVAAEEAEDDA